MRFSKPSTPAESKGAGPSGQNNIIFLQENEPEEEDNTVAAFMRSADGETLTKQQRMKKMSLMPTIIHKLNPRFPLG